MSAGGPSPTSSLLRQAVTYGWTNALILAFPLLLAPVFTHYLSPADYGLVAIFEVAVGLASPLVGLGMQGAIRRRYFDQDAVDLPAYLSSCLAGSFLGLIVVTTILLILQPLWSGDGGVPLHWGLLLVPWLATNLLFSLASSFLQLEGRVFARGALQAVSVLVSVGLSLLLVIGFGLGWQGRVLGQATAAGVVGLVAGAWLWRRFPRKPPPSRRLLGDALRFGVPTVPYSIVERVISFTDRTLVIAVLGLSAGGTYVLAVQLAGLVLHAVRSFLLAWEPWLYGKLRNATEADRRRVVTALYGSAAALTAGVVGLNLVAPLVLPAVISERYHEAFRYLPWLTAALAFRGLSHILARLILFRGRNVVLSKIAVLLAALNVLGNLVLIPLNGALGAAQATCLAFALGTVLTALAARRAVTLPWSLRPLHSAVAAHTIAPTDPTTP